MKILLYTICALVIFSSCGSDDSSSTSDPTPYDFELRDHFAAIDRAFDNTPADNPTTVEGVELGRHLFYDQRLSKNDKISCASCHKQENGFSDPVALSKGFEDKDTKRHSMSLTNMRWHPRFFWDARANTLEEQALMPIQDPIEMGMDTSDLKDKLALISLYPPLFKKAFDSEKITAEKIGKALAQFVRTIVSQDAPFDDLYGQPEARVRKSLSDQEYLGYKLFTTHVDPDNETGKNNPGSITRGANCSDCHNTILMTNHLITNNGLDAVSTDLGYGAIIENSDFDGTFKTPTLRNIELTAPYMHDGRFATLREVLDHYDSHVKDHPNLDPQIKLAGNHTAMKLDLLDEEKDAIIAYLKTMTDPTLKSNTKFSSPF